VRQLAIRVWRKTSEDELFDRAAGLSYYFLFALFPTLLFLTALLGLMPVGGLADELLTHARRVLPPDAASLLERTLGEVVQGASGGLLSIGILAALWGASSGMASIIRALNVAYDCRHEARPWWRRRLVALVLTLGLSLFTLAALFLLVFGARAGEALARWLGLGDVFAAVWTVARWPALLVCILTGIALVYHLAPAARRPWHWITPGSVFAAAAWVLASLGLRVYVASFADVNKTYGSIGGVILLVLWLYATGVALLLGAEIDSEIASVRNRPQHGKAEPASIPGDVRGDLPRSVSDTRPRGAGTP
jgi:membrane protein